LSDQADSGDDYDKINRAISILISYADRQKGAYKQGLQEGRQEEKFEVAKNLLQMKMPVDDIVKATGLQFDELKRLAAGFPRNTG
jgi:predicted transposase/invertase (TIGR01784 family)